MCPLGRPLIDDELVGVVFQFDRGALRVQAEGKVGRSTPTGGVTRMSTDESEGAPRRLPPDEAASIVPSLLGRTDGRTVTLCMGNFDAIAIMFLLRRDGGRRS